MERYEFLDIGCSKGGSLAWGRERLGGRGLGIDISPKKVLRARTSGQDAIVADATNLAFPDGSFRFCLFFDVLEHMPHAGLAERCVSEAYRVSREFVLIRGPNFDGEAQLRALGLKRYYADWKGHTWHHEAKDFLNIIQGVQPVRSLILAHNQVLGSEDSNLLPLAVPPDQGRYDPRIHGAKPVIKIRKNIFTRLIVVLAKDPLVNVHELALLATGSRIHTGREASAE